MRLVKPSFEILTLLDGEAILASIERAGRTCYKSEDKITPESSRKFVAGLIRNGHHSVIEHESISVRIVCDRGVSHEIVRHRLAAYSQESTRYCNYSASGVTFVIPPWVDIEPGVYGDKATNKLISRLDDSATWAASMSATEDAYQLLLQMGQTPQQARSVLPNSLKTEIVMTANLREWRHVFSLRCSKAAHPQMREIMLPLLAEFKSLVPVVFDDIQPEVKE